MNFEITAIGEILFDVYPEYKKLGGAPFNFIYHVRKLTGCGKFISRIGDDDEGIEILTFLQKQDFDTAYVQKDLNHPTGAVNVKLDENRIPTFQIIEDRAYDFIELNRQLEKLVKNSDLFYFGTLAQRSETTKNTIQTLGKLSEKVFCDLNIRQNFYSKEIIHNSLKLSSVVKLNEDELELINKLLLNENGDLKEKAQKLLNVYKFELLCITMGSEGAYLFDGNNISYHKTEVENLVDTVGAGDAYAAMMSLGYLNNWSLDKTNKLASEFAAEICKIEGAIPGDEKLYENFTEKINYE